MVQVPPWLRLGFTRAFDLSMLQFMMLTNSVKRSRRSFAVVGVGLICAFGLIALSSCASSQRVLLRGNGSGTVHFRVKIEKILVDAAKSLSPSGSTKANAGEFDIPKIKEVFSKNPDVTLQNLSTPSTGVLAGSFTFNDIGKLFSSTSGSSASDIVSFTRGASSNVFKVHITRNNFSQIAELAGMKTNPLYQMFGPEQNSATSEGDLDQMMTYVLGSGGPAALKASTIDVEVQVNGKIISQSGGVVNGNTVHFHIPLVRLLLLQNPLDYSITFS